MFWETTSGQDHHGFPFSFPRRSVAATKPFQLHSPANAELQFAKRLAHKEELMDAGIKPKPPRSATMWLALGRRRKTPKEGVQVESAGRGGFSQDSAQPILLPALWGSQPFPNHQARRQCQLSHSCPTSAGIPSVTSKMSHYPYLFCRMLTLG